MAIENTLQQIGNSLMSAAQSMGSYSAQAAARANDISRQAQSAAAAFNNQSANQANMLNESAMANQYGFNSAMMTSANQFNANAWLQAADWNENMWQKQADFNREEAEKNRQFNAAEAQKLRDWQEYMSNSAYQRGMADMAAAGLNPILAYSQGGATVPGGSAATGTAASVGGAQMSSATAQMASGGLLGANSASIGGYQGQMEQMSSTLALIGAFCSAISSAQGLDQGIQTLGDEIKEDLSNMSNGEMPSFWKNASESLINDVEKAATWVKNKFTGENEKVVDQYSYNNLIHKNQRRHNTGIPGYDRPKG